jgi:hypothetical protein
LILQSFACGRLAFFGAFDVEFYPDWVVLSRMAEGFKSDERFSGRPDTLPIDAFWDWLEAAYWKAVLKEKRLTKAEFLRQLPAYLDHEALRLWHSKKD